VVDPAKVPGRPYKPNAPHNAVIGLFSGLILGVTFVVMRERADRAIQQPGDAGFYLNTREIGIIPSARVENRKPLRKSLPASSAGLVECVELVTAQHKQSMLAEAFRSTLISILFSGDNGAKPVTVLLTSPNPSEGKSTLVCNLGIAIAEMGNRVLLIDADLRRPRLHNIFGVKTSPGLSDLLKNRSLATSSEAREAMQETEVPNLFVLAGGTSTSAAITLLYGTQLPELLRQLRGQFDTILIDTPPMLQIPDARLLGRLSDRVILVIRAGKTTRDAAQAALQRFQEDGTEVLGTILNDWNPKYAPNGYYGYGGYDRAYSEYYGQPSSTIAD